MKLFKILFFIIVALCLMYIYNHDQITNFRVRDIKIFSNKIKNTLKITQISDFHSNHRINLEKLKNEINRFNPDIIALTGDIIDYKDMDLDTATKLLYELKEIGKDTYFVLGNHETNHKLYKDLKTKMEDLGIIILENSSKTVKIKEENINIIGLKFTPTSRHSEEIESYKKIIEDVDLEHYNLLLVHSPNNIKTLIQGKEDLVLSGHTHGGQVRFPLIGPIVAPGQGFFPKYDKGIFRIKNTTLYIDSGLGNSVAPFRGLNSVQISNITIESKSEE